MLIANNCGLCWLGIFGLASLGEFNYDIIMSNYRERDALRWMMIPKCADDSSNSIILYKECLLDIFWQWF